MVTPLGERMPLRPGEHHTGSFAVMNSSGESKTVNITLMDFLYNEMGGVILLKAGALGERSLADEITYLPDQLVLGPGEHGIVDYEFTVPEQGNGPHWVGLLVRTEEPTSQWKDEGEGAMSFVASVYVQSLYTVVQMCSEECPEKEVRLMAVDVNGLMNEEAQTKTLVTHAVLENTSQRVLLCTGYLEIRDSAGETILQEEISRFTMLPGATRIVERRFDGDLFRDDQYIVICVIDFGGESLIGGQLAFSGDDLFVSSSEP